MWSGSDLISERQSVGSGWLKSAAAAEGELEAIATRSQEIKRLSEAHVLDILPVHRDELISNLQSTHSVVCV